MFNDGNRLMGRKQKTIEVTNGQKQIMVMGEGGFEGF
jgi:hypothetical protein